MVGWIGVGCVAGSTRSRKRCYWRQKIIFFSLQTRQFCGQCPVYCCVTVNSARTIIFCKRNYQQYRKIEGSDRWSVEIWRRRQIINALQRASKEYAILKIRIQNLFFLRLPWSSRYLLDFLAFVLPDVVRVLVALEGLLCGCLAEWPEVPLLIFPSIPSACAAKSRLRCALR